MSVQSRPPSRDIMPRGDSPDTVRAEFGWDQALGKDFIE